jgi:hypothetical protein
VDLSLLAGLGQEVAYVDRLLARFASRRPDARRFALDRRVLLVETASGVPVDISRSAL